MSTSQTKFLAILMLVAFLVRMAAVLALRDIRTGPTRAFGSDGIEYDHLAAQVASGNGYGWEPGRPTSFRAPGFPLTLAALYSVSGHRYPPAYLLFCLLGAASCVLTYGLVLELANKGLATLAAILSVFYLPHIYFTTGFDSEIVFVFCLGLSVWLLLRYLRTGSLTCVVVSGLALGWGVLTRPFALLLIPLFVSAVCRHLWRGGRIRPAAPILLTLSSCIVVVPWTLRNYGVFHHVVLVATNGGSTFYGANNDRVLHEPRYYGGWISTVELPGRKLIDAQLDEVLHDKMEWQLGKQWVRTHLSSMPRLLVYKFVRLWLPDLSSGNKKYVLTQVVFYTPFLLLLVIGVGVSLRNPGYHNERWLVIHSVLLATVLTALIFWGSPRFRDANMPVLMAYAALGLQAVLLSWRRSASQAKPGLVTAG